MKVLAYHTGAKAPPALEATAKETAADLRGRYAGAFHDVDDGQIEFADRPGAEALLQQAAQGDCIVVPTLEDLAYTVVGIEKALEALRDRGLGLRQCADGPQLAPDCHLMVALHAARLFQEADAQQRQARRDRRIAWNQWARSVGEPVNGDRRWGERRVFGRKGGPRRRVVRRVRSQAELDMLRHLWGRWKAGESIMSLWRAGRWKNSERRRLSYWALRRGLLWFDKQLRLGVVPGDYAAEAAAEANDSNPRRPRPR